MHPDLEKLLELQSRDEVLLAVDLRLKSTLDQLSALDGALARSREDVVQARTALAQGVKRREDLEAKVEGLRVLQERRRHRVDQVKTQRELQALTSELELARSVLAKEESEWFRLSEQVQDLQNRLAAAEARVAEFESGQVADRSALEAQIAALQEERGEALARRNGVAAEVSRGVLQRYDRLRQARQTTVVVAIVGDACGACFTAIPMSRRSGIRAGLVLEGCEACGVLLYASDR